MPNYMHRFKMKPEYLYHSVKCASFRHTQKKKGKKKEMQEEDHVLQNILVKSEFYDMVKICGLVVVFVILCISCICQIL